MIMTEFGKLWAINFYKLSCRIISYLTLACLLLTVTFVSYTFAYDDHCYETHKKHLSFLKSKKRKLEGEGFTVSHTLKEQIRELQTDFASNVTIIKYDNTKKLFQANNLSNTQFLSDCIEEVIKKTCGLYVIDNCTNNGCTVQCKKH